MARDVKSDPESSTLDAHSLVLVLRFILHLHLGYITTAGGILNVNEDIRASVPNYGSYKQSAYAAENGRDTASHNVIGQSNERQEKG